MKQHAGDDHTGNRIAIVLYCYGLGNSPSLINMAEAFARSGYMVDFYTCSTYLGNISFSNPSIRIYDIKNVKNPSPGFLQKVNCLTLNLIKKTLKVLPISRQAAHEESTRRVAVEEYAATIVSIACQQRYAYLIGVEPLGMMAACILSLKLNAPFIYYNMELHSCPDIVSANEWALKNIERSFHGKALFTITQDKERARIMASENNVANDSFVTIPVCADGDSFREKTNCLRQRLGLNTEKIIVLYAGFLAEWALCEEIAITAKSWPDNCVLVLHSHGYHDAEYLQKLRQYEGDKVRFSGSPVDYDDLPALLASADIGVALYKDLGTNFTHIGSASGKLAHYLKSGLPVIVNDYPQVSKIVDTYNCGIGIGGVEAIGDAIVCICRDYEKMREGAFSCYENEFRFSKHFQKVLKRINVA
jgi:glycosyltransferase involved in cell wall biosynthesis